MTTKSLSLPKALLARLPQHRSLATIPNASAAIVAMTSLLMLVQISGVASLAYEVQRLEDQRSYWQESNYRAETDIARLQSLGRIEEEATSRLKMVPAKDPIPVLMPRPLQPAAPLPLATPTAAPKVPGADPWWQRLVDILDQIRRSP